MTIPNRFVIDAFGATFARLYTPEYDPNSAGMPRYSCAFLIRKDAVASIPEEIRPLCIQSDYVPDDMLILNTGTQFAPVIYGLSAAWLEAVTVNRIPMDRVITKLRPRASAVVHMTQSGKNGRVYLNLIAVELAMPGSPPTFQDFVDGKY